MKIGILLPLSKAHPGVGPDFMDGLQSFLKYKGHTDTVSILKENISFGAVEKDVFMKAEKLLMSDDVDVLIAYIDEKVLPVLYALVQATGKLMLVVNPGANYPVNWITQPTVIHLSLQHAFLCWLTGSLAAGKGNSDAALATTYYDCGYLHAAAMVNHFMESGGDMKFNYVNNQLYDANFDTRELTDFLSANPACKKLLCVFDELPAGLFYKLIAEFNSGEPLHLFASPMMLQQKAFKEIAPGFPHAIDGFIPWQAGSTNDQNVIFENSCTKQATIFSLLGWETAMILDEILPHYKNAAANSETVIADLKTRPINSPRGELKLDPETQFYIAPAMRYRREAGKDDVTMVLETDLGSEWKAFTSKPIEGAVTGWMNTYLCY